MWLGTSYTAIGEMTTETITERAIGSFNAAHSTSPASSPTSSGTPDRPGPGISDPLFVGSVRVHHPQTAGENDCDSGAVGRPQRIKTKEVFRRNVVGEQLLVGPVRIN